MAQDHYAVLGVDRDADPTALKKAYRRLARQWHPDVNDSPEAADKFKDITTAYEVLSDPQKRAVFDRGGDPLSNGGMGGGFGGAGFSFDDIMDAFFGQSGRQGPRSRVQRGQDALLRLTIDLVDAAFGVTREIKVDTAVVCELCDGSGAQEDSQPVTCGTCHGHGEVQQVQRSLLGNIRTSRPCPVCHGYGSVIPDPCPECSGDGRVRARRTIEVEIPAGVDDGNRIQLGGEGEVGPGGGPAGDLYVEIRVAQHPVFTRQGDNLFCQVSIPMSAAALGTRLSVPGLDDRDLELEIPAGLQAGDTVVLRGEGVPRLRTSGRGDLTVQVIVETPRNLSGEQRELLEQLAVLRGEEHPEALVGEHHKSVFGRLRDAFR